MLSSGLKKMFVLILILWFGGFMFAKVNINIASEKELTTLNGIGPSKAKAIIEYRNKTRFKNKEDIMNVKGIGQGLYDKIKDEIIVTTPPNPPRK
ncbi:DNA-binding protein [Helicobacter saguini]|uniref:DNA-binding protein n=1 Tax=Helicobacter saguini TaxID=1548018 RepID=A0A347VR18_9HELI|nr:helix-hairpin-helix domain-containing protein [Helicobacter saguini]MWV63071.1 DNA-binding protein [Helicobacter saguini]MWV66259.1 DNA-binding protein [Helicobacter saguini]MWV68612.1 DNA-binding protein [Helicobacter saguini]MWV71837.1 DNA-binding protein [Helicobacter saguini]TLD95859.1 DNA-binding protein [Helicobacter saguini]